MVGVYRVCGAGVFGYTTQIHTEFVVFAVRPLILFIYF